MVDRLGQRVGNYTLTRLLGRGGFAEVYLGQHLYLGNRVAAIKILSTALGQQDVEVFLREAQTLSELAHPHIVHLLDFSVEQNVPFLIMEYLPGGTLRQQIPVETVVPLEQVLLYVSQAAEALQYAHEKRVMHRDIKPENMLLRGPHDLVLTDFGIAVIAHSTQSMGAARETIGTASYMAPEQIQGHPRPASDQYALGVTAYEWLCGVRPFRGSLLQLYYQHLSQLAAPLREHNSAIPPAVEAVVLRALAKDWQQRFPDIQTFALALEQAARSTHLPPPPELFENRQPSAAQPKLDARPPEQANNVSPAQPYETVPLSLAVRDETVTPVRSTGITPPAQALHEEAGPRLLLPEKGLPLSFLPASLRHTRFSARALLLIALACAVVIGSFVLFVPGALSRLSSGGTISTSTVTGNNTSTHTATTSNATGTSAQPAIAPADKQIFRYPLLDSDIATFDPALSQDTASDFAIRPVFTGLVGFNDKLEVIDQLASSHQVSADGLTYTFSINPAAKFSDGTPVTADDVAFSIDRTLQPATKSQVTNYMSLLKDYDKITTGRISTIIGDSVIVVDAHTIKLIISKPAAYFLVTMTYDCWYVVEKSLVIKYSTKWTEHLSEGGGAGPYKVQKWDHNKGIDLVPNPYWYGPTPKLQHIEYYQSGNTDATYQAYQAGQFDYTTIPTQNVSAARSGADFHEYPILVTTYLSLNYLAKPFNIIPIRQAFALAINRDVLNQTLLKNTVSPSWHFIPPGMPGYNANLTGPDGITATAGDTAKAQTLFNQGLAQGGYANAAALPPIKITYYAASTTTTNYISAIMQMWKTTLGVTVTAQTLDFAKLLDNITASQNNANGLQIWRAAWQADYPDPQDWLSIFFSPKGDDNDMNYGQNTTSVASTQQQVQSTLAAADVNQDKTSRIQAYETAEQSVINDVGIIPLWQPKSDVAIKTNVYGIVTNSLEIIPPNDWSNIYITQ